MNKEISYNLNKGKFLTEFYSVLEIPNLFTEDGTPSDFAKAAHYWNEPIPKNKQDLQRLVLKGHALLNSLPKENKKEAEKLSNTVTVSNHPIYTGKQNLSILNSNKIKVPFVKKGEWKHELYGEVTFDEKDIQSLINNFKLGVTGFKPYLTLGHLDEEHNSTDSHRKRGDLEEIVQEGDVTYGIFSVPEDIYKAVEKGEYEYSSGEFHRNFVDNKTGKKVGTTVIRVALTNSPFLPFGDKKIQTLSLDTKDCPQINQNFMFSLNIHKKDDNISKNLLESKVTNTNNNVLNMSINTDSTKKDEVKNVPLEINKELKEMPNQETDNLITPELKVEEQKEEVKSSVVLETKKEEEVPAVDNTALTALATQLEKVQSMYQTQLDKANEVIKSLTDKVEVLGNKLTNQEVVTQAFSTTMNKAQEQSMIVNLQNSGVTPANVQKFMAFKQAYSNSADKSTVKLSIAVNNEVKEVEKGVLDAVADLLISASNQSDYTEQQLGISSGRRNSNLDFTTIIARNNEKAVSKLK